MIILSTLLFLFVTATGFLAWYSFNALRKLQFMTHSIEDLDLNLQTFESHLKHIYQLDMYYGDQTLEGLIKHMKELSESFSEFRKDYDIFNGDLDEQSYLEEENDAAKKANSREDLLYQRS